MVRPTDGYGGRKPFQGKGTPASRRSKPKAKKNKKRRGSGWGLLGVGVSFIAAIAAAAVRLRSARKPQAIAEKNALGYMLLKPLLITEHGACRMDCRWVAALFCFASLYRNIQRANKGQVAQEYWGDCQKGFQALEMQDPGHSALIPDHVISTWTHLVAQLGCLDNW